jgi:alpha,alpha-trehalase
MWPVVELKNSSHPTLSRILVTLAFALASQATAQQYPDPPQVLFKDLYAAVEMEHVFADSKEFADAVPKSTPAEILKLYHSQKPRTRAELKRFVEEHFNLPQPALDLAPSTQATPVFILLQEHITALWDHLQREARTPSAYSSLVPLPRSFVVPGARFRELYYWDSYFVMLGLAESGRQDLVQDLVANFAYLIDTYGHIPNGNRTYYLSRSQPPFFFKMVGLLSPEDEAVAFAQYLPQLKKEYAFWMEGAATLPPGTAHRRVMALSDGSVLNRYWDDRDTPRDESYREDVTLARSSRRNPRLLYRDIRAAAESGWDFSSRWFADGHDLSSIDTSEIIPPDLNSLLFGLENAIRSGCERVGDQACALDFARRAAARRAAVDQYLWDETAGCYFDYDYRRRKRIPRVSAATLYPLFVGMAGDRQAARVAAMTARQLVKPGGLAATTIDTGQQWDSPNGWAPLQWIAIAGLRRYGHTQVGEEIACRWMVNVSRAYQRSGKLVEKYDVITPDLPGRGGEYPLQDGFGWTNGVMLKLIALYPKDSTYADASSCAWAK